MLFKADSRQIVSRLDEAKIQSWLTATDGDEKATRSSKHNFLMTPFVLEGEGL